MRQVASVRSLLTAKDAVLADTLAQVARLEQQLKEARLEGADSNWYPAAVSALICNNQ